MVSILFKNFLKIFGIFLILFWIEVSGSSLPVLTEPSLTDRLDCALIDQIDESGCKASGCIWSPVTAGGRTPWCFLDRSKVGYLVHNTPTAESNNNAASGQYFERKLTIKPDTKKLNSKIEWIDSIKLRFDYLSEKMLRIKISDPDEKRYQVPIQKDFHFPKLSTNETVENAAYEVSIDADFGLVVKRKTNGAKLIDTSIGGLLFGDQFLQIATKLASKNLYGLGENFHETFRHDDLTYKTFPIFARDRAPSNENDNLYGSHPFYMVVESDGKAHGVLLLNSNAMAYTVLPEPAIVLKTTGGILDLFVFVGDSPEEVIQLYTSLVGRPAMPPFWALGYQLSRYGYRNTSHVKSVIKRNLDNGVPLDVHYMDIDYMDEFRDFTYDRKAFSDLPQYIEKTKSEQNLRWTLILDPAIEADTPGYGTFDAGLKQDVFIKWPKDVPVDKRKTPPNVPSDHDIIYGKVWPKGPAAFPDFFKNKTQNWWVEQIKELHDKLKFDALWIDMNEPSNFNNFYCPDSKYNVQYPQLKLENLNSKTLCMDSVQGDNGEYRHYDVHNLYGYSESEPTLRGLRQATGKRGFVVSRSTFVSSSRYAAHWLGDNTSNWPQLRQSIIGMLEFSLFGFNFIGADICGFIGNTNPELCLRWQQLGAYYPFSRNHNEYHSGDQDPGYWKEIGHPEVTNETVKSLRVRYQLLHYLYTRFYKSYVAGDTLARSVMHEFPTIAEAHTVNHQFFLGPSIMVCPFVNQGQTKLSPYVPPGTWYKFSTAINFVDQIAAGSKYEIPDSESYRPLLLRGGTILPIVVTLPTPLNAHNLRKAPLEFWILPNSTGMSSGDLFWDNGESIDTIEQNRYNYLQMEQNRCNISIISLNAEPSKADIVEIFEIKFFVKPEDLNSVKEVEAIYNVGHPLQVILLKEHSHLVIKSIDGKPIEFAPDLRVHSIQLRDKANPDKCFIH